MSFSIGFLSIEDYSSEHKKYYSKYSDLCLGQIAIGEFAEIFESSLSFWNRTDYEAHWSAGLTRILRGARTSCLITSITNPAHSNFLTRWLLYREKDNVIVQNQLFILKDVKGHFDPNQPYRLIEPYSSTDQDGMRISEWYTTVQEIAKFMKSTNK